jgi:hypothetical protein
MNKHWEDVKNVSDIMIYFPEKVDPDEIELYFTDSKRPYRNKDTTPLVERLKKRRPQGVPDLEERWLKSLEITKENSIARKVANLLS